MPPYKGHEYSTLSVNILEIRAIKSRVKIKLKLNVETLSFQYPYVSVFLSAWIPFWQVRASGTGLSLFAGVSLCDEDLRFRINQ